jgi:hypothetical protein
LTSSTPKVSSSCFTPADKVGWVTPHASAARPKCFSRAKARRNSSFSSNGRPDFSQKRKFHVLKLKNSPSIELFD